MYKKELVTESIKRATFALEQAAIKGDKTPLLTGEDTAIGFSKFLK